MSKSLIAVVGPTAVGKTGLAIELAQRLHGEIVGADSRQIYRYMDIGTAKPTPQERQAVPHHLIDFVDPDEDFSLALFKDLAMKAIGDIHQRGKLPLLVGGSGLYVWAVLEGWRIPEVSPDPQLRHRLQEKAEAEGPDALFAELERLDPQAAKKIDPRNVRRVIRALEVCKSTGKPFSGYQQKNMPSFETLIIGLTSERDQLYWRINARVDQMIEAGFVGEVQGLLDRGYSIELSSMSSLGYREIIKYLYGKLTLPKASERIKFETHRFARHQYAWFKLNDPRIHWFDLSRQKTSDVAQLAEGKLRHD